MSAGYVDPARRGLGLGTALAAAVRDHLAPYGLRRILLATADAAIARSDSIFYASHNWHPFFLQGTKTLAYELWEDLGFRPPDNIITPCGAGCSPCCPSQ